MTRALRYMTGAVFALALLECAHQTDWASRIEWEELSFDRLPGKSDYPGAGAVVLLDDGKMEIYGSPPIVISYFEKHRIIKVLDKSGLRHANVALSYTGKSEIDFIQARTLLPDGSIIPVEPEDIHDITLYPDFMFYSDQRAKIFTFPAVSPGSVLEYRYRMNIWNPTFWHSWTFQSENPTLLSRFTLIKPSEWELNSRIYGMEIQPRESDTPEGFKSTHIWEARDIPAYVSEWGAPPFSERGIWLCIAPVGIKTWDDAGRWYYELSEPQTQQGEGIKKILPGIIEDAATDREKLRGIYEWVRDEIRYVAVSIGMGGYQPYPAEEVLIRRYGDCKDMTTLLCAMAREAGLKAYPVLISTWQNGYPDTTLASQLQFNHVIAYCPQTDGNGIWLDATQKGSPFPHLPWYNQGLPALIVGENGKVELTVTERAGCEENMEKLLWDIIPDSSGRTRVSLSFELRGAPASELREELTYAPGRTHKPWIELFIAERCPGARLDTFRIHGLYPVEDPLRLSIEFTTESFFSRREQYRSFTPGALSGFSLDKHFRSLNRNHPVRFPYGSMTEMKILFHVPDGWKVVTLTNTFDLVSLFGDALWEGLEEKNVLSLNSTFRFNAADIPPSGYGDFRTFLDDIRRREMEEIVLETPVPDSSGQ